MNKLRLASGVNSPFLSQHECAWHAHEGNAIFSTGFAGMLLLSRRMVAIVVTLLSSGIIALFLLEHKSYRVAKCAHNRFLFLYTRMQFFRPKTKIIPEHWFVLSCYNEIRRRNTSIFHTYRTNVAVCRSSATRAHSNSANDDTNTRSGY